MDKIKLSLDREPFWQKPEKDAILKINNRIGGAAKELEPTSKEIRAFAERVGIDGQTFCPASFKEGRRKQENFEQQQFFALDFDNKEAGKRFHLKMCRSGPSTMSFQFSLRMILFQVQNITSSGLYFLMMLQYPTGK